LVAISAFGGLSVHIMTSSRMCFVGARNGHMPAILSHINIEKFSPTPSLVFLCILSLIMLVVSDVHVLITYCSIVESFFIMLTVSGVLWFRYKRPNMERPIKAPLWVPIVFVIICAFLVIVPVYVAPYEVGIGVLITIVGIPFYYVGVVWRNKPEGFTKFFANITITLQKIFLSAKEEKDWNAIFWSKITEIAKEQFFILLKCSLTRDYSELIKLLKSYKYIYIYK